MKLLVDESIIFWAFRYCLGRRTYAVSDCVDNILNNWDKLTYQTKQLMFEEIEEAITGGNAGMQCDVYEWRRILEKDIDE